MSGASRSHRQRWHGHQPVFATAKHVEPPEHGPLQVGMARSAGAPSITAFAARSPCVNLIFVFRLVSPSPCVFFFLCLGNLISSGASVKCVRTAVFSHQTLRIRNNASDNKPGDENNADATIFLFSNKHHCHVFQFIGGDEICETITGDCTWVHMGEPSTKPSTSAKFIGGAGTVHGYTRWD